jgi:hypothetical protein
MSTIKTSTCSNLNRSTDRKTDEAQAGTDHEEPAKRLELETRIQLEQRYTGGDKSLNGEHRSVAKKDENWSRCRTKHKLAHLLSNRETD